MHFQQERFPNFTYSPSSTTDQNFIASHLPFVNDDDDDTWLWADPKRPVKCKGLIVSEFILDRNRLEVPIVKVQENKIITSATVIIP
jgi:hypothetical protein